MDDDIKQASNTHHEETVAAPGPSTHSDVDEETALYAGNTDLIVDEATSRKYFWKVNKRILALLMAWHGMSRPYHVPSIKIQELITSQILYMGILVGEYPTNLLLQKLPVAKYLAFKTSMWYTKREQSVLTSLWYCMLGVQLMVGGIIAWGATHYVGHAIKNWQMMYLVLGTVTCGWACFLGWWLPDSPMKAKCFDNDQKRILIERIRANETGIQNKTFKHYQMIEALTDPVIWCYFLIQVTSTIVVGGLGIFSNIIISSFGFDVLQTQLLNIAQGAVLMVVVVGGATLGQTTGQTVIIMQIWSIFPIIGTVVMYTVETTPKSRVGLLISFYLTQFFFAEGNMVFSLISRNTAGQTKKTFTMAMVLIGWAAGNMAGPQVFQGSDSPRYHKAFIAHFCLYVIFNITAVVLRILLKRRNKKKRLVLAATLEVGDAAQVDANITHSLAFADLTDKENPDFRKRAIRTAWSFTVIYKHTSTCRQVRCRIGGISSSSINGESNPHKQSIRHVITKQDIIKKRIRIIDNFGIHDTVFRFSVTCRVIQSSLIQIIITNLSNQYQVVLSINNEAKVRRSTRSLVLGKAKVMSYEDITAARAKRAIRDATKGKGKRGRKQKSALLDPEPESEPEPEVARATKVVVKSTGKRARKRKSIALEADQPEAVSEMARRMIAPEGWSALVARYLLLERHSIMKKWLTNIFVIGDVFAFLVRAGGAGTMVFGTASAATTSDHVVTAGLRLLSVTSCHELTSNLSSYEDYFITSKGTSEYLGDHQLPSLSQ
ncbi:hypothetical protein B7494_g607 [Chlorociboria aeruginascens]|nr:hypothetical protein B7494_g607 [Chlorociboria aeruginascens]